MNLCTEKIYNLSDRTMDHHCANLKPSEAPNRQDGRPSQAALLPTAITGMHQKLSQLLLLIAAT
jgi:hypothetical protein